MLHTPLSKEHARFGDYCWDVYSSTNKAYEREPGLVQHRTEVLHALEEGNQNLSWIGLPLPRELSKSILKK